MNREEMIENKISGQVSRPHEPRTAGAVLFIFLLFVLPSLALANAASAVTEVEPISHRMMMLMLQLGTIIFAARIGGIVFERMKLPAVLGELTLGIVIGPHLLGGQAIPGFPLGLFPPGTSTLPVSPELYGICSVAAVVLLFNVGLETDLSLFVRYSVAGGLVGLGGVAVSFVAGDFLAVACSEWLFGRQMGFFSGQCLMMGIIMTATSVGITARILSEQRKMKSPEGVTILAGAVVDDVLGIILLAVGLGVIAASQASGRVDWAHIGIIGARAVGIWLAATVVGILSARRISAFLKSFGNPSVIAILALGLALTLSGLFEKAGLAMIIGAYVMGLSLSRTDISHLVRERLAPTHSLLIPVFFVVMGMFVDLHAFASPKVLLFGLFYSAVAIGAKLVGCGIPALLCRFNTLGALRIGAGMLPRGEVTLIIAGTGMAMGILNGELFGVVVFTTLLSSLVAPPVLIRLFKIPRHGLRNPVQEEDVSPIVFRFPSARMTELLVERLLDVFRAEGFFVHELSRREQIFQIRKDDYIIAFQRLGDRISFQAHQREVPFINTAMMEVVAELEGIARELSKPKNLGEMGPKVQYRNGEIHYRQELSRYLSVSLLFPSLKGDTKEAALNEMLDRLAHDNRVKDLPLARSVVWEREQSMSTGMQHGIALPHARTDAVSSLVCAVGMKRSGIEFGSIDGEPTRIIVLTLSPESASAPQIRLISTISQVLDEFGRKALLSSESPGEMFLTLTGIAHSESTGKRFSRRTGLLRKGTGEPDNLKEYLTPGLVQPDLQGRTAEQVIDELLGMLVKCGFVSDQANALDEVLSREKAMPTGLEHGIAVPHCRTGQVDRIRCALGISRSGVDFGAFDGKPSKIIMLVLSPLGDPSSHIRLMAVMGRSLDAPGRERLLSARTVDEVFKAL